MLKAGREFFPLYVEALERFGSPQPPDWQEAETMLDQVGKLYRHPLERDLRRRLHAESPAAREAARQELARRGRIFRCWLQLQPSPKDYKDETGREKTGTALAAARSAYYTRLIETRQKMLALGDDAADLLIDTYIAWLPRASLQEQMILRDELEACGPRVIPILKMLLALPSGEQDGVKVWDAPLRLQAMLVLTRFADHPEARAAIEQFSQKAPPATRKLTANALRESYKGTGQDDVCALLLPMLRDDASWEVRAAAAQALGDLGNPKACPTLLDALVHPTLEAEGDRVSVAKFVVAALGKLRCGDAVEPLVRVIEERRLVMERERKAFDQIYVNATQALHAITGKYFAHPHQWRQWLSATKPDPPR